MAEGFAKLAKLLAFDTVCLLLVVGFSLFLKVAISPPKWGFSCDDISIMHPNKPSTVSNMNLYLATVVVPTTGILTMEARRLGGEGKARLVEGLEVPLWLVSAYREAGSFFYGAAVTEAIAELTKVGTGKLRLHFLQACTPEPGCDGLLGKPKFIRGGEYRCKNKKDNDEMRKSFLSGHSSISLFSMVFLAFYLERHPPLLGQDSPLVTPTCQLILEAPLTACDCALVLTGAAGRSAISVGATRECYKKELWLRLMVPPLERSHSHQERSILLLRPISLSS